MARFLGGLKSDIANVVELQPCFTFDEMCKIATKCEKQIKAKVTPNRMGTSTKAYEDSREKEDEIGTSTSSTTVKRLDSSMSTSSKAKAEEKQPMRNKDKIKCFKCHGFGHYQVDCPNNRALSIIEVQEYEREINQEALVKQNLESEVWDVNTELLQGETLVLRRTLHSKQVTSDEEQRGQLFHARCLIKGKVCNLVIDGGSCANVVSNMLIEKLKLPTQKHPEPYRLRWLSDGDEVRFNGQALISLAMGVYEDKILCDIVPMNVCHVLLGRPWQFDHDTLHYGRSNEYVVEKWGKKFKLKPLSPSNVFATKHTAETQSLLASEKKVEKELDDEGIVYSLGAYKGGSQEGEFDSLLIPLLEEYGNAFREKSPPDLPH